MEEEGGGKDGNENEEEECEEVVDYLDFTEEQVELFKHRLANGYDLFIDDDYVAC